MKKGINLQRKLDIKNKVKEELKKAGVPDIHELKLKPVNRKVKNISSSVNNTIVKKAGKQIGEMKNSNFLKVENLKTLKEEFEESPNYTSDDYKRARSTIIFSLKKIPKQTIKDEEIIVGDLVDSEGVREPFVTIINDDLEFKNHGCYRLRSVKGFSKHFISYSHLKGLLFLFDKVGSFLSDKNNIDEYIYRHYLLFLKKEIPSLSYKPNDKENILELKDNYKVLNDYIAQDYIYIKDEEFILSSDSSSRFDLLSLLKGKGVTLSNTFYSLVQGGISVLDFYSQSFFLQAYDMIVEKNDDEVRRSTELYNSSNNYAKSFETKMNIPDKILDRMDKTPFLSHFNYVEFDETVDLEKLDILEKDWLDLLEKVDLPVVKDQELRFRRLGKYKASGLYFPYQKSLCVDIRTSTSFIHEFFHLIDYNFSDDGKRISSKIEFLPVLSKYVESVEALLEKEEFASFKKQMNGNSKYNRDYYFSNEEVFARCGELYLRDINSHLIGDKIESSPFYPANDELLEIIDDFYDSLNVVKINQEIA